MKILAINSGSSSVKFTLFQMDSDTVLAYGLVERIGLTDTHLSYKNSNGAGLNKNIDVADTSSAVTKVAALLQDRDTGVIQSLSEVAAVGHRVVHGGEKIKTSALITEEVKKIIEECIDLAPLHNPPNLEGIRACETNFPGIPQVAVFDTAFHTTLPDYAFLYGIPYRLYEEDKIRKYGFHGTSHQYVCQAAAELLQRPLDELKTISCHLGNGCSITAVDKGKSTDTSMGFTPLEGLIMGTRCGDLDPAIVFYLMEHKNLNSRQINELLNKQSGLLGLAGAGSSDLRDIFTASKKGNQQANTAISAFVYRIKKYIGAYTAAMGGLNAIVFTAGIGENSALIRELVCSGLESLGIVLDLDKNARANRKSCQVQSNQSRVKILVVPTNEERAIALQTMQLLQM
ncbi:MAG: acetate kinase [Deltaproteobacteria bacterium]|nr:acetate kinase [Deltaproteobacteria bacterium]